MCTKKRKKFVIVIEFLRSYVVGWGKLWVVLKPKIPRSDIMRTVTRGGGEAFTN